MSGHLFLAPGDLTHLTADAVAYSSSCYLGRDGDLCSSFEANVPGFGKGPACEVGDRSGNGLRLRLLLCEFSIRRS